MMYYIIKKEKLAKSIGNFQYDLDIIQEKDRLIRDLLEKQFEYRDASNYGIKNGDNKQTIQRKLLNDEKFDRIICFNGILCRKNKSEWNQLVTQLFKERRRILNYA